MTGISDEIIMEKALELAKRRKEERFEGGSISEKEAKEYGRGIIYAYYKIFEVNPYVWHKALEKYNEE